MFFSAFYLFCVSVSLLTVDAFIAKVNAEVSELSKANNWYKCAISTVGFGEGGVGGTNVK